MKTIHKAFLLLLGSLACSPVFAGTGSLYSPAGLPQSSSQSYTVPSPQVQGTTVTFPTPPIPLGGALQDFPSSSLSVSGSAANAAQGGQTSSTGQAQLKPPITETGSIETFFQCPPSEPRANKQSAPAKIVKSPAKLLWHVLDNLGVPMIVGKDNDLDPSLTHTRFIPPELPHAGKNGSSSDVGPSPNIPEKIPQSELEGTEVFPNGQTQATPK